jgi:hypothetical protein
MLPLLLVSASLASLCLALVLRAHRRDDSSSRALEQLREAGALSPDTAVKLVAGVTIAERVLADLQSAQLVVQLRDGRAYVVPNASELIAQRRKRRVLLAAPFIVALPILFALLSA